MTMTNWFYALIAFLVIGWAAFAYDTTTGNLVNQDFTNNSWSGTNQNMRHGNNTIAGVDGKYVESTISLRDTLTQEQINGGFQSALGADIWFWNNREQSVVMKQTIGGVTQTRIIDRVDGYYNTYTDTIIVNENTVTDYDVNVRFEFNESGNSNYHYAADLKNPTLVVTYWNNPVQPEVIEQLDEVIEEFYEWQEQFEEPAQIPIVEVVPIIEEFEVLEEVALEELTPLPNLEETFEELEEEYEEQEILQTFGGPEIVEEPEETQEELSGTVTEEEVIAMEEEEVSEPNESTSTTQVSEIPTESEESVVEDEPTENSTAKMEETKEEPEVESPVESDEPTVAEGEVEVKTQEFSIDVADVEAKVAETVASVSKQLQIVSVVAARALTKNQADLSSYTNQNANLFDTRQLYKGNNYTDTRTLDEYAVDVYTEQNAKLVAMSGNDPMLKYQQDLQDARLRRIQLETELYNMRRQHAR